MDAAEYLASYRGADKNGDMGENWCPVIQDPSITQAPTSLKGAMEACQQLFDSGLLYCPSVSEFRICQASGADATVYESKPPHGQVLRWQQKEQGQGGAQQVQA